MSLARGLVGFRAWRGATSIATRLHVAPTARRAAKCLFKMPLRCAENSHRLNFRGVSLFRATVDNFFEQLF